MRVRAGPTDPAEPERTHVLPLVLLLIFATVFPEVLSGSTPAPVFATHPLGVLLLAGLYGCGAVLVWEAVARWRKGWLAVLPLGLAYGIAEEGIGTKVFTDAHQQFVITGLPGAYGRWAGIEWVPTVGVGIFHAVVSIGLELLLVALIFPSLQGRSIVSRRALVAIALAFAATVTLMFLTNDPGAIPSVWPSIAFLGAVAVVFVVLGRRLPDGFLASWMRSPLPTARPRTFVLAAFAWLLSFLAVFTIGGHLVPWPAVVIAYFLLAAAALFYLLTTRAGWRENRAQQVGFVGGLAAGFVAWDVFLELRGDVGVLAFTGVLVAIVVWLWRHPTGLGDVPAARPSGTRAT